jgi:hypothetical protein
MALVHYLYVGHFIPEGGLVRYREHRPCTTRPLNTELVTGLLRKYLGDQAAPETLPEEWGMSIFPDYIVCYVWSPRAALQFAADYADQEGATIVDMGSFSLMTPAQLRQSATCKPASVAGPETGARAGA